MHVHVLRDGIDAKFWLWLEVKPDYNNGFNARMLRELTELIEVPAPAARLGRTA